MRYAHLAPGFLQDAVNKGSLGQIGPETVTATVTSRPDATTGVEEAGAEVTVSERGRNWLGDQDSNLGNQIQSSTQGNNGQ